MVWDKKNFEGKVIVVDIKQIVEKFIFEMKVKGVDVIVVIFYFGISIDEY